MKKTLFGILLILGLIASLTLTAAAEQIGVSVDFAGMDPNESLTAEEIGAYEISNVKIAVFNSEGNILAAGQNGTPSYVIYKLSAGEGNMIKTLTLKSYASVNDYVLEDIGHLAGNVFKIFVGDKPEFDFENGTPVVEGMVGKKNHTWTLTNDVVGMEDAYVCLYFLNNSAHVDWVRFYSFAFSGTTKSVDETEPPVTEAPAPETKAPVTEAPQPTVTEAPQPTVTEAPQPETAAPVTEAAPGQPSSGLDPIAIVLIVAGVLIVAVVVAVLVASKKKAQ